MLQEVTNDWSSGTVLGKPAREGESPVDERSITSVSILSTTIHV